jgi:hypothetical protein
MRCWLLLLLALCFVLPLDAAQQERVILPGAAIKGIEATPRVTFIVPWQRSRMKDFPLLPVHSALDELYTPLSSRQLELDVEQDGRMAAPQR